MHSFFCYILFIHKFHKYVKGTCYVPDTAPGFRNREVSHINKTSYPHEAQVLKGQWNLEVITSQEECMAKQLSLEILY